MKKAHDWSDLVKNAKKSLFKCTVCDFRGHIADGCYQNPKNNRYGKKFNWRQKKRDNKYSRKDEDAYVEENKDKNYIFETYAGELTSLEFSKLKAVELCLFDSVFCLHLPYDQRRLSSFADFCPKQSSAQVGNEEVLKIH